MAAKKTKEPKPAQQNIDVTIRLEPKPETPFYYVNCISVGHSAYDFVIGATRVPFPLSPEQLQAASKGQAVTLEPILQLVVPPSIAKGLMDAIADQLRRYEEQFGKISPPPNIGKQNSG